MEMPALLSPLPVFSFSFFLFFFTLLQLTFPADETEHSLPAPTLITLCLPGESMSFSLFRAPSLIKGQGCGEGLGGFTRVTPIKTNVSSLSPQAAGGALAQACRVGWCGRAGTFCCNCQALTEAARRKQEESVSRRAVLAQIPSWEGPVNPVPP